MTDDPGSVIAIVTAGLAAAAALFKLLLKLVQRDPPPAQPPVHVYVIQQQGNSVQKEKEPHRPSPGQ